VTTHRPRTHDYIIVGAGISGPFIAHELCRAGADCLMIEAGRQYRRHTYPRNDLDGSAQLYWSGGLELSRDARLAFLRPKVVGGGSVVNQALVDRFDDDALDSWNAVSGVDFFSVEKMTPWYASAEADIAIQTIPVEAGNRNALTLFQEGFEKLGYRLAPLRRAQKDCRLRRRQLLHRMPQRLPHRQQAEHAGNGSEKGPRAGTSNLQSETEAPENRYPGR
jgi:choline dehydrogenase-like flavoprotein